MSFARRRLTATALSATLALGSAGVIPLWIDGAWAQQRRPAASTAQSGRGPGCFEQCNSQCRATGNSGGACSRTCYGRCSGVIGDSENRH